MLCHTVWTDHLSLLYKSWPIIASSVFPWANKTDHCGLCYMSVNRELWTSSSLSFGHSVAAISLRLGMLKLIKSVGSTLTVTDIEQKHVSGQLNSHDVTDAKGIRDVTDGLHGGPSTVGFPWSLSNCDNINRQSGAISELPSVAAEIWAAGFICLTPRPGVAAQRATVASCRLSLIACVSGEECSLTAPTALRWKPE